VAAGAATLVPPARESFLGNTNDTTTEVEIILVDAGMGIET
jgi:hypothetical protein